MAHQLTLSLPTLQETRQTGMALGGALERGALCLFFGEMAAGKTTLIKSICAGMGIPAENVISPTYTLVNIYPATPTVYHVDLFRLEDSEAMLELDRDDWLHPGGITLIEWPELALPLLEGEQALELHLAAPTDSAVRNSMAVRNNTATPRESAAPAPPGHTLELRTVSEGYQRVFEALQHFAAPIHTGKS